MIRFSARVKPNFSELVEAVKQGFEECELALGKESISNTGLVIRNIELAKTELGGAGKKLAFSSISVECAPGDILPEKTTSLAKSLGCPIVFQYSSKGGGGPVLRNPEGMDLEGIVKSILGCGFDLALDISALYRASQDFYNDMDILLETYTRRIRVMYFADSLKDGGPLSFGEGNMRKERVAQAVASSGFDGAVVLDVARVDRKKNLAELSALMPEGSARKRRIRAVFFDADKTLYAIDTDEAYRRMYDFLEKETGEPRDSIKARHRQEIENAAKSREPAKRQYMASLSKITKDTGIAEKALEIFWSKVIEDLKPFDGVVPVAASLKNECNLLLAVTSDEFLPILKRKLNRVFGDYAKIFSAVVTPEDVGEMKPSAKYYLFASEKLGIDAKDVVVVGDSCRRDLKEAKALDMKTVLFRPEKIKTLLENFGEFSNNDDDEDTACADHIASSYAELKKIIYSMLSK